MTNSAPDTGPRVPETRARQGFRDKPVLWVLGISLLAAAVLVFGAMLWRPDRLQSMEADAGHDRRDAELYDSAVQPPKGD